MFYMFSRDDSQQNKALKGNCVSLLFPSYLVVISVSPDNPRLPHTPRHHHHTALATTCMRWCWFSMCLLINIAFLTRSMCLLLR